MLPQSTKISPQKETLAKKIFGSNPYKESFEDFVKAELVNKIVTESFEDNQENVLSVTQADIESHLQAKNILLCVFCIGPLKLCTL